MGGSGPPSKYRGGSSSGGLGKKVALVILLVAGLAVGVIFGLPLMHFASQSPPVQDNALLQKSKVPNDNLGVTEGIERVAIPSNSQPNSNVKVVSQQLVAEQLVMLRKDVRELSATIPAKNDGFLEAKIIPEKGAIVDVTLYKNGAKYCVDEPTCSFTVKGSDPGTQKVMMPVKTGDNVKAVIISQQGSGFSQLVNVVLSVQYEDSISTASQTDELSANTLVNQANSPEQASANNLKSFALGLINVDRAKFGLEPVKLSNNTAAQVHAEDVLKTRTISHWMTNGEKPYMTYSRLGGVGDVAQNVAYNGYSDNSIIECKAGLAVCAATNPKEDIERAENQMMYDDAASNWGHRDNILDQYHTDVSIGIAYDQYTFVMVQNFENKYINFTSDIQPGKQNMSLVGELPKGDSVSSISIYYDPLPTNEVYQTNKDRGSYGMGEEVGGVAPPGSFYEGITTVSASTWTQKGNTIDIEFNLSPVISKDGVYTALLWLDNPEGKSFTALIHSVIVKN